MSTSRLLCRSGTSLRPAARFSSRSVSSFIVAPVTKPRDGFHRSSTIRPVLVQTAPLQQQCLRTYSAKGTTINQGAPLEFPTDESPARTGLYGLHKEHCAKFVPFGGYEMPVQYSDLSVGESHKWTREKCSLFDVGHMVQYHITGPGAEGFLESVTPAGLKSMPAYHSTLSALLHPSTGGICDDCIITRLPPTDEVTKDGIFYLVTNAGCRKKDYDFLTSALDKWNADSSNESAQAALQMLQVWDEFGTSGIEKKNLPFGLIALQGPLAASILESILDKSSSVNMKEWYFGQAKTLTLHLPSGPSSPITASRGGYTGEDGFELSISPFQTAEVVQQLLAKAGKDKLRLAGLGARDSLRLEAGMCLYGHDLDDSTTPVEAALGWIIPKDRRSGPRANFPGAETIIPQLTPPSKGGAGVSRRRIGLIVEGAPAREGATIVDGEGNDIGKVTSGCPSPTLGKNIAMGYIKNGMHKAGTEVKVVVRGKPRKATVAKMPFVPSKYFKAALSPG